LVGGLIVLWGWVVVLARGPATEFVAAFFEA
jgi:hypothetical protein